MWSINVTEFVSTRVGFEIKDTYYKNTRYLEVHMLVFVPHVWANLS